VAKEILLYHDIWSYSAEEFIKELDAAKGGAVDIRINGNGGEPEYGWGMIAKLAEHKGGKKIKVDGKAHSMYAYLLCYVDDSEGLDVSSYTIHRAAYPEWYEQSPIMTPSKWTDLNNINSKLRAAIEAKINVEKFEQLKGVTLDEVFSNDNRIDVTLSAQEALEIGLINRIVKITPEIKAQLSSYRAKIAAQTTGQSAPNSLPEFTKSIMNIDKLKAEHPALYEQIVKDAQNNERDRVGAWMAFVDVDPDAVKNGIKDGSNLSATAMAEFTRKALSASALKGLENESAETVKTGEVKTEASNGAKDVAAFMEEVNKHLQK
jgi:ATP-dependent protease ClpP protease subunit